MNVAVANGLDVVHRQTVWIQPRVVTRSDSLAIDRIRPQVATQTGALVVDRQTYMWRWTSGMTTAARNAMEVRATMVTKMTIMAIPPSSSVDFTRSNTIWRST